MGEHGQEPQYNPIFIRSKALAPTPVVLEAFTNESYKTKASDAIDQNKVRPSTGRKICLVLNIIELKKFCVLEFIKYTGTQCPITHLKSHCYKMAEVVHNDKLLMHFFKIV